MGQRWNKLVSFCMIRCTRTLPAKIIATKKDFRVDCHDLCESLEVFFLRILLGGVIAKKLPFVVYPTPVENQDQRSRVIYFQTLQALNVAYTDFLVIWPPIANFKRALLINSFSWLLLFFSQGQANILTSFTKMKPCTRNIAKTRIKGISGSHSNI